MSTIPQITENLPKLNKEQLGLIWGMVAQMLPEEPNKPSPFDFFEKTTADVRIRAIIQFMWENLSSNKEDIEKYLFEEFRIGWDTIRKIMPNELGCTPRIAFEILKLEKIAKLLIASKKPDWKIIAENNIEISNFGAKFKKRFGLTPRQYRIKFSQF